MSGLYVTGNFYLPADSSQRRPTILYLCGHSANPLGAKVEYQDRAQWFAKNGYPCLILDTLEFGEVPGIHHGTHNLNMWNWLSLGYTPAGVEVWSAIRALDYLESRPEVDSRRIGVTGISGGGAMTWYTAAVDDRVAAAVPVCSAFTFGSQTTHWLAAGQCDCIYYNNTYGWDFPIVAALIAPRPLLILSGRKDTIFPPDGYHEVFQRSKRIYDLYAGRNSDQIKELDDNVPHSDPPLFLREARHWMQRWLKNDPSPLSEAADSIPREKPEDLACLSKLPSDATNYKIHNQFTLLSTQPNAGSTSELLEALKAKVFRWFPTSNIPFQTRLLRTNSGYMPKYADYKEFVFQTEEAVRVRAQLIEPKAGTATAPLLIYAKRPGDSVYAMDMDELTPLFGRYTVLILNPRFTEQPMSAAEYTDIERTAVWLGRTIASMQTWDILRAVQWAIEEAKLTPGAISVYGKGDLGILALYAALFDKRIAQIILNDPPASHWQRPALLNVLRVTDIPEVVGALAPRQLVSLTKLPPAFDLSKRIFRQHGASARFGQADSLPEALQVWKYPSP
jgi:cephalosporin-C deacetylase-like acetyl esterase